MMHYVRIRTRENIERGLSEPALSIVLREAEHELQDFVKTLCATGKMTEDDVLRLSTTSSMNSQDPSAALSSSGDDDSDVAVHTWSVDAVEKWLHRLNLGQHAKKFAAAGVDGGLLLRIDDADLADELGVTSRLERKRVLLEIDRLRAG